MRCQFNIFYNCLGHQVYFCFIVELNYQFENVNHDYFCFGAFYITIIIRIQKP